MRVSVFSPPETSPSCLGTWATVPQQRSARPGRRLGRLALSASALASPLATSDERRAAPDDSGPAVGPQHQHPEAAHVVAPGLGVPRQRRVGDPGGSRGAVEEGVRLPLAAHVWNVVWRPARRAAAARDARVGRPGLPLPATRAVGRHASAVAARAAGRVARVLPRARPVRGAERGARLPLQGAAAGHARGPRSLALALLGARERRRDRVARRGRRGRRGVPRQPAPPAPPEHGAHARRAARRASCHPRRPRRRCTQRRRHARRGRRRNGGGGGGGRAAVPVGARDARRAAERRVQAAALARGGGRVAAGVAPRRAPPAAAAPRL